MQYIRTNVRSQPRIFANFANRQFTISEASGYNTKRRLAHFIRRDRLSPRDIHGQEHIAMAELPLLDKIAWVTGSSRGIGRVIADHLAGLGAQVAIHGAALPG